jgi:hypothetical protein
VTLQGGERGQRHETEVREDVRCALLLAVALAAAAAAGAAARPAVTFEPAGAHLALDLPSGWQATPPDRGWRFEAIGPGSSGWVFLSVVRAVVTDGSFQRSLIAFERGQSRRLGPHVTFRTKRAMVAGERAVEVYAAGRESNAQLVYGFQHGGLEYILVFATTTSRIRSALPVFAAALTTVRFTD